MADFMDSIDELKEGLFFLSVNYLIGNKSVYVSSGHLDLYFSMR